MKRLAALALICLSLACFKTQDRKAGKAIAFSLDADIAGFDPAMFTSQYDDVAVSQIYQPLLKYKYLARPYALEPLLAEAMPEVSDGGKTYTFRIRPGVFFHDDPAFGGRPRALTAGDFVYAFRRIVHPALKSPNLWMFDRKLEGLEEFREKLKNAPPAGGFDAVALPGVSAPDDRTLVIKLVKPNRQFLYPLAMAQTSAVAREVVEKYGAEFLNHPVGTGPFLLKEWVRGQKIRFERNPNYWAERYPAEGTEEDRAMGRLAAAGRTLPLVDRVDLWIYVESQTRWLNFLRGNLDITSIPKEGYDTVYDAAGGVKPDIRRRKIVLTREQNPDLVFFAFNMDDPVVGKNVHLRKAISCAVRRDDKIRLFYNGRAMEAHGPIPPGFFGYDANLANPNAYNPARARELMVKARELHRAAGEKGDLPPLFYDVDSASTVSRQFAEALASDLSEIGVRLRVRSGTWSQFQERLAKRQSQFFSYAWNADYPDPENFLSLLYGKNASPGPNRANYANAEYDRLFERMRDLPDGPERKEAIERMVRLVHEDAPWIFFVHRIAVAASQAWVRNFKRMALAPGQFKYYDVDPAEKEKTLPLLR